MAKFRRKNFTIREGLYTGPKDMKKVPGFMTVVAKSTLAGMGIGAGMGIVSKNKEGKKEVVKGNMKKGAKYGAITGLALKAFLNHIHKPMSKVKYQKVDEHIRKEFNIYNVSGITIGDTLEKRNELDSKFGFNDKNILSYKVNFVVQNNKITMYTLRMTDRELEVVSNSLDYYCKKYSGMEYTSTLINAKTNSYSVVIVFTNYDVISKFINEISIVINAKVNILNDNALVENKLTPNKEEDESKEKQFSTKTFNKYDLIKIFGGAGTRSALALTSKGTKPSVVVMESLVGALGKLTSDELSLLDMPSARRNYNNKYLESVLKKLHYVEGFDYFVGDKKNDKNISLNSGRLMVTLPKSDETTESFDKNVWGKLKSLLVRTDMGTVIVYSYLINSKNEFDMIIKKIMAEKLGLNIFE